MEVEVVLKLFDAYWFEHELLKTKQPSSNSNELPVLKVDEELEDSKNSHTPALQILSRSDHFISFETSFSFDSPSPDADTVLKPKLRKILSGEEIKEGLYSELRAEVIENPMKKKSRASRYRISSSKSLSELEFEELKGFADLGFVFSEEDKDSNLVSIIPGLQRLGRNSSDQEVNEEHIISRPYLSEAWGIIDRKMVNTKLEDLKIQGLQDRINMKDHLRVWAQTVASTLRY